MARKGRTHISHSLLLLTQEVGASPEMLGSRSKTKPGKTLHTTLTKLRNALPQDIIDSTSYHGFNRLLEKLMKGKKKIPKSYKLSLESLQV